MALRKSTAFRILTGEADRVALEQQRADLTDRVFGTEQLLDAAEEVERARVVTPAASTKVDARNTRTSTLVGAFLGLVLAALAALLWAPVSRLRAS